MSLPPSPLRTLTSVAVHCRDQMLGLLFPPVCLACRASQEEEEATRFCLDCTDEFAIFGGPFCNGCGKTLPLPLPAGQQCGTCGPRPRRYDRAVALGPYHGLLRELLLKAKRPPGEAVMRALGQLLGRERRPELATHDFDVVCPVPMHWRRRVQRLTNSASGLAEVLARELRVPFADRLMRRRRYTPPQSCLPPSGRKTNVRHAFGLGAGYRLDGAHVLLVDDILTTGATCNEVASVLKRNGAAEVTVAVVARSFSGSG